MLVAEHVVAPGRQVLMRIELTPKAEAMVYLDGIAPMPCFCGSVHEMHFEAQLGCNSEMEKTNLDDLEMAIRGNDEAAQRLAWRMLTMLFNREVPPCQQSVAIQHD